MRVKGGKRGKHQSLFHKGQFIAIDGEGFSEGEEHEYEIASSEKIYKARQHFYSLLSASDGAELYSDNGRLGTAACLDFIIDRSKQNRSAILVCFSAPYDVTQMLYDIPRADLDLLMH